MITKQTPTGEYAIHYLTDFSMKKKTLVCLHGFMGTAQTFQFLGNQTDFNVIAIDLVGHGHSEQSLDESNYTLDSMALALEAICLSLKLTNIYLLGYSLGGRVALTYAHTYPNRLEHLFLESASFGLSNEEEKSERQSQDNRLAQKLLQDGLESFVDYWQELPLFASQKLLPLEILEREVTNKKKQSAKTMSLVLRNSSVSRQPNFLEMAVCDSVPITFIAGSLDVKYVSIGKKAAHTNGIDLIVVENAGHCVHLEEPLFVKDILYAVIGDSVIELENIYSLEYDLDLVTPFKTSYGEITVKKTDIFVLTTKRGTTGFGELLSFESPDYIEETLSCDRLIIKNDLVPLLKNKKIYSPRQIRDLFKPVKGNQMAKSAIETAVWDLFAKEKKISLGEYLELESSDVVVGVSIGIQESEEALLNMVKSYVDQGYTRVKLKISKEKDLTYIKKVRDYYPHLIIMVDSNSSYHLSDRERLKKLDIFNLAMLEQPLGTDDFYEHSLLQKEIQTPICLDENIRSLSDVRLAHHLGSCQSINLKVPRVGGLREALDILEYAEKQKLSIWLGGMLESGVGRSLNVILANHPAFSLPGDLSASNRYYTKDTIVESFNLDRGKISPIQTIGIGVSLKPCNIEPVYYLN